MRISGTLSLYIGRQFLVTFLALFGIFLALIFLVDTIELLRRSASRPDVSFVMVVNMALLKLPHMGQEVFPFCILFGGMMAFWRLTRSHELVVSRAAGVSAWQFLFPVLVIAILLGIIKIAAINPMASAMLAKYQRNESLLLKGQQSAFAFAAGGLWLRQSGELGQSVVHAKRVLQQGIDVELFDLIVFKYKGKDQFDRRIDAESARLEDGFWHVKNAWISVPEQLPVFEASHWLETDLTLDKIQDSFAPPETMSFWALPGFIKTLEKAGFSALRHRLHWHSLLASPFLMCAMVLIAATFTLRHARRGGTVYVIGGGVITGFVLYFFSDIVFALGLSDSIPVTLAAWTPSGVSLLLGVTMLLYLEDG